MNRLTPLAIIYNGVAEAKNNNSKTKTCFIVHHNSKWDGHALEIWWPIAEYLPQSSFVSYEQVKCKYWHVLIVDCFHLVVFIADCFRLVVFIADYFRLVVYCWLFYAWLRLKLTVLTWLCLLLFAVNKWKVYIYSQVLIIECFHLVMFTVDWVMSRPVVQTNSECVIRPKWPWAAHGTSNSKY